MKPSVGETVFAAHKARGVPASANGRVEIPTFTGRVM
jgi:hypothetical protein